MGRVIWTNEALSDLEQIARYIRQDSPAYAKTFALKTHESVGSLAQFPLSGRVIPEAPLGPHRDIIVGRYRVIYRTRGEDVVISSVVHGARELRTVHRKPDEPRSAPQ